MAEQLYDLVEKIRLITRSGKVVNLLDLDPNLIDDRDIAYALSHVNRWTGHAPGMNVAFHTCIVAEQVELAWDIMRPNDVSREALVLAAWLHDAPETYVNDCVRPLKKHLGEAYSGVEGPIHDLIFRRYGLDPAIGHHPILKLADTQAGRIEAISFKLGASQIDQETDPEFDLDPGCNGACFPNDMYRETLSAAMEIPWGFDPEIHLFDVVPNALGSRVRYLNGLRQAFRAYRDKHLRLTQEEFLSRLSKDGLIAPEGVTNSDALA